MEIWLLLIAAFCFSYLAVDAHSMGRSSRNQPYEIEATARGEKLDGVPLAEQRKRQAWSRGYGVGDPSGVLWVWIILAIGCFAAALSMFIG
jgi:hypothetical protein